MKTGEQVTPGNNLGCSVCMYLMLRLMLLLMWAQSYSDYSYFNASCFPRIGGCWDINWDGNSYAGIFRLDLYGETSFSYSHSGSQRQ